MKIVQKREGQRKGVGAIGVNMSERRFYDMPKGINGTTADGAVVCDAYPGYQQRGIIATMTAGYDEVNTDNKKFSAVGGRTLGPGYNGPTLHHKGRSFD